VGAAVQDSNNLTVSFNWHAGYGARRSQLEVLNAHFGGEFTAACRKAFLQLRVKVIEYSHAGAFPSVSLCRLKP
jgi:hypothetical protein